MFRNPETSFKNSVFFQLWLTVVDQLGGFLASTLVSIQQMAPRVDLSSTRSNNTTEELSFRYLHIYKLLLFQNKSPADLEVCLFECAGKIV